MSDYSGTANLEVMVDAINYNNYLLQAILAEMDPGAKVLDFGAGTGTYAARLAERGVSISCVEPDTAQAEIIAAQEISVHKSLDAFKDGSFDLVYSLNVLEHIEDDIAALRAIHRKIRLGGRILIYVPAFPILHSTMDRKVGHVRRYVRGQLEQTVRAAGFRVRRSRYVDSLGFFAALLYKFVGSDSGDINRTSLIIYDRLVFPLSRLLDRGSGLLFGKNIILMADK